MYTGLLAAAAPAAAQQPSRIDTLAIRAHTYFLADDLLEGRGTGRRGVDLAAAYLAGAAERLGLQPVNDSFFQDVPLVEADVDTARTTLRLTERAIASPRLFIPNAGTGRTLVSFGGEIVRLGTAAEILANTATLPALSGRVVMMNGVFGAEGAAADTLRARGATGVIQLLDNPRLYDLYVASRGPSRLYLADTTVASSFVPNIPAVLAHPSLAQLSGRVDVTIATRPRTLAARNVIAMLPGSDPALRHEYVVYTAHYDHLGISVPEGRDSIYNGFSDNAAGSAMLLAIAQAMSRRPPARSVVFLWLTGEERGLLGSDWFVARPAIPLGRIAGVINLDAGAPPAPSVGWRIAGGTASTLGPFAVQIAERNGWTATTSTPTPNSDYFPFVREGVPSIFIVPGPGPFENMTTEASQDLRRRWDRYHQAGDHWAEDFPFSGLQRYATYALLVGEAVANRKE